MATTPNYDIDYNDQRFKNVETEKNEQLSQMNSAYNSIVQNTDKYYQDQINASNEWAQKQTEIQQANTDFAIEKVNQQKEEAYKDYTKEQKGAYVDYQKQTNAYGANAEAMAAQGLLGTGFSESSQVSMYNTYQNRVSTARDSYNKAILNYDNSIKEAQLANNSALAEIAYNALQTSLELSLQGFQYKNDLLLEQMNKQQELNNTYYNRWQDVQSQINTENAMKEEVRQYNENMAFQQKQLEETKRQYEQDYALKLKQYQEDIRQFDTQIAYYKEKDAKENAIKIQQLEEQKRQAIQEQANWEKEYALQVKQVNASIAKSSSGSSSGSTKLTNGSSSSSSSTKLTSGTTSTNKTTSTGLSSEKYNQLLNTARTTYNATKLKSGSAKAAEFVADLVARSGASDAQAAQIAKSLGIK